MEPPRHRAARLREPLRRTLEWALARSGGIAAPQPVPLAQLAAERGLSPRTLREHLARLEALGLIERVHAGQSGLSLRRPEPVCPRGPDGSPDGPADAAPRGNDPASEILALLTRAGVYPQVARALAAEPWVTVELVSAWIRTLERNQLVRNLAAMLVHTLQDPARCVPAPAPPAGRFSGPGTHARIEEVPMPKPGDAVPAWSGEQDGEREAEPSTREWPAAARGAAETRARALLARDRPPEEDGSARLTELWARVRAVLSERLPAGADELWLQHARPQCLSDGVLIIAIPSTMGADWLNLSVVPRSHKNIREAIGRPLLLRFIPAGLRDYR